MDTLTGSRPCVEASLALSQQPWRGGGESPGRLGWSRGTSIPGGSPVCAGQVGLGGRWDPLRCRNLDAPALEQRNSGKIAGEHHPAVGIWHRQSPWVPVPALPIGWVTLRVSLPL